MSGGARSLESIYLATQPLLVNLIGLPAMAYIVRSQGEEGYGQWQTAMTLTGTLGVMSYLGLRPYLVRAVAQDPGSAATRLAEQLGLRLFLATLAGLLSVGACLVLGYSQIVLLCTVVASLGNLLTAITYCFSDVLEGLERFVAYTNATFAAGIALTCASVLVCLAGYGPVALSLAYLTGPAVSVAAMGLTLHRQAPLRISWQPARYRELLRESRYQARANLLGAVEDRAEPLLLPKVAGYANTGYFAAGNIPASRLVSIPYGLASFYFPKLAKRHGQNADLNQTVTHMLTLMLLLTLPTTLGVCFLSDWVAGILFPARIELCAMVMRWTSWSLPLAGLGAGIMTTLQASGRIDHTAKVELATIVLALLVTGVLVAQFGLFGAAISWLVRAALGPLLLLPSFWGPYRRGFFAVPWWRLALACGGMQAIFFLAHRIEASPSFVLLGGALAGSAAFLGILAVTGVLTPHRVSAMLSGGVEG